jgi:putative endonuclease
MKEYWVYMLGSFNQNSLYIGVTSNLLKRIEDHKSGAVPGYTKKYKTHFLVWYEKTESAEAAILREKQLKKWRREKKELLIQQQNPARRDLALDWA